MKTPARKASRHSEAAAREEGEKTAQNDSPFHIPNTANGVMGCAFEQTYRLVHPQEPTATATTPSWHVS
jgi:hypothetical protein